MNRDQATVNLIQSAFPGRDRIIAQGYRDSQPFRELCLDYRECVATLERWTTQSAAEAVQRQEEYSELLTELRQEIESWLDVADSQSF